MLDLRSFAFSAPFGIGPITEYALTGKIGIDPAGYLAWGALGATAEFAILGTTKFSVYAPVVGSALFGELGLFTVTGLTTPLAAAAGVTAVTAGVVATTKKSADVSHGPHGTVRVMPRLGFL